MLPERKNIRLKNFNYSSVGYYYITVCAKNKQHYFGKIEDGKSKLNQVGVLIETIWKDLPNIFLGIELDIHVVMPNHFHGIIIFNQSPVYRQANKPATLSQIVGAFKSKVNVFAKRNILTKYAKVELWQKTFYDRVIRSDAELEKIREYIQNNPLKWELDEYYRK